MDESSALKTYENKHLAEIEDHIQKSNPLITTPMLLEKYLVEGAYNKVILYEKAVPSPYYAGFIRIIAETVRKEIAAGIEKAAIGDAKETNSCLKLLFHNLRTAIMVTNQRWQPA
ncbi:CSN8/PSMD8/EIF3K family domain-containing protein [Ditylenchus destructor]|uniref:CSN8/PSMD8/EIF3K family domain-containing protein n=1 Tax=Ditylenchus destructor TaxID=166010 RepID=A0AAD4NJZ5_9BILA|nr:CSN8/PSMD8/EIF3K family domain-containing protein [Ditylenchus destructor]